MKAAVQCSVLGRGFSKYVPNYMGKIWDEEIVSMFSVFSES